MDETLRAFILISAAVGVACVLALLGLAALRRWVFNDEDRRTAEFGLSLALEDESDLGPGDDPEEQGPYVVYAYPRKAWTRSNDLADISDVPVVDPLNGVRPSTVTPADEVQP